MAKWTTRGVTASVNARIEPVLMEWLQAEAQRQGESLSAALRRALWAAMLEAEAAKQDSDRDLGVDPNADPDPEVLTAEQLRAWSRAVRRGTVNPSADG